MIFFSLRFFFRAQKSIALTMLLFPFELDINGTVVFIKLSVIVIYISLKLDINFLIEVRFCFTPVIYISLKLNINPRPYKSLIQLYSNLQIRRSQQFAIILLLLNIIFYTKCCYIKLLSICRSSNIFCLLNIDRFQDYKFQPSSSLMF